MYYKNITGFIFITLVLSLFAALVFSNPTSSLVLMFFIGFLVIYQTIAVLKGPKVKENSSEDQWYEHL